MSANLRGEVESLRDMLTRDEGRRNKAYRDTRGLWTIGIGHCDPSVCSGMVWSDAKVDAVFAEDVAEKTAQVEAKWPWVADLSEPRRAIVIAMCFQLGLAGLSNFKNTLAAMERGDYLAASKGMLASLWARQTPLRVARMARQMRWGEWA